MDKYTGYKLRVAASTAVGESSLTEEDDIFVFTLEDGMNFTHTSYGIFWNMSARNKNLVMAVIDYLNGIKTVQSNLRKRPKALSL